MLGAVVGDIIGSVDEFTEQKRYDFEMLPQGSRFTDDTVMTIAVAHWLVYRVDVHCYAETTNKREDETEWEVRITKSFIYPDWACAESKLNGIVTDTDLKDKLYAVYIYQLPIGKDVSDNLYQRLWAYDRNGKLNGQSRYSAIAS